MLNDMIEQGMKPDCITYNYVLDGLCRVGRIKDATGILDNMVGRGCMVTVCARNCF